MNTSESRATPPLLQTRKLPLPVPAFPTIPVTPVILPLPPLSIVLATCPPWRSVPPLALSEKRHPRDICSMASYQNSLRSKRSRLLCQVPGCINCDLQGGGYCLGHGGRKPGLSNGDVTCSSCVDLTSSRPRNIPTSFYRRRLCQISGCQRTEHRAGLCSKHLNRIYCNARKCRRIQQFNGYCALHQRDNE